MRKTHEAYPHEAAEYARHLWERGIGVPEIAAELGTSERGIRWLLRVRYGMRIRNEAWCEGFRAGYLAALAPRTVAREKERMALASEP